ncbi:transketolase C-terminal domain-containing protein, partial [Streptomyces sp. HSW2009]|uniref:transketolase C-terminal domain-containing protein n=1 Tax=Streptomyces sp. HSW2009 TaxID=3142890 RepID=UPI0032EB7BD4
VNSTLVGWAAEHELVVTVEDNGRVGGVGSALTGALRDARITTPVHEFGLLQRFSEHGSRDEVLSEAGLTADAIADVVHDLLTPAADLLAPAPAHPARPALRGAS